MAYVITLTGIDEAISDLNYHNKGTLKYLLVHTIRQFYIDENSIESLQIVDTDKLIKSLWDTGNDLKTILNKRKNYNSIKSSVNSDLKKLYQEGKNPEGIVIGPDNIFEMSDEAKNEVLKFAKIFNQEQGPIDLGQITDILDAIDKKLADSEGVAEARNEDTQKKLDEIKKLIESISQKSVLGGPESGNIGSKVLRTTSSKAETIEELEEDESVDDLEETESVNEIDEENVPEDAEEEEIDDDFEVDEILDEVNPEETLDEDEFIEKLEEDESVADLEETESVDKLDEEDVPEDVEEVEIDDDLEVDEILDEVDPEEELEEDESVDDLEETESVDELDEEDVPEDAEEEEIDDDFEVDEILDEVDPEAALEESESVEELDTEELPGDENANEDFVAGGVDDRIEEIEAFNDKDIQKNKHLSEEFNRSLAAMDRHYNQYIIIPEAEYIVGGRKPKKDERHEQVIHLSSFYCGKFPVTNALFELFVESSGYRTTAEKVGYGKVYYGRHQKKVDEHSGQEKLLWNSTLVSKIVEGAFWYQPYGPGSTIHKKRSHPVVQVGVEDAMAFAAWTGKRLPTENEWEAATRTSLGYVFPWGNDWRKGSCNVEESHIGDTTPVDKYIKVENGFGIVDSLGNVLEWTMDRAELSSSGKRETTYFIVKGGNWTSGTDIPLFTCVKLEPESHSNILGFRCVAY